MDYTTLLVHNPFLHAHHVELSAVHDLVQANGEPGAPYHMPMLEHRCCCRSGQWRGRDRGGGGGSSGGRCGGRGKVGWHRGRASLGVEFIHCIHTHTDTRTQTDRQTVQQ